MTVLVAMGEIGLLGELRPVSQVEKRVAEAGRLGFERCILPDANLRRLTEVQAGRAPERSSMQLVGARTVEEALALARGEAGSARQARSGRTARDGYGPAPDRAALAGVLPFGLLDDAGSGGDEFDDSEDDAE